LLTKILRVTWIPVILVLFYSGWLVWQRHSPQLPPRPGPQQRDPLLVYGDRLEILDFYGTPSIARGANALLCYGVVNAKSVRLDPPQENVWPALSRCFNVSPARTTRYTLTAGSANGQTVSRSFEVKVQPSPGP
jgi:hypothetical protein